MSSDALDTGTAGNGRVLPPGQQAVEALPVLHVGVPPDFDPATWQLSVEGAVRERRIFGWRAFTALERLDRTVDLHCVTGWSVLALRWRGVALERIAELVGVSPEARWVRFFDGDLYDATLPLEHARDVLLATELEGQPLAQEHGGPLRAIVPGRYAWKSVKWLRRLEFTSTERPGFWERRGYSALADPLRGQRMA